MQDQVVFGGKTDDGDRSLSKAARHGLAGQCPACGKEPIFDGFLKIKQNCNHCHEELFHHRADDLPAYLNIFIVGHIVLGAMMIFMKWELLGMWETMFATMAVAIVSALALMRPLKGMVVGTQWALRMHGFGGHDD